MLIECDRCLMRGIGCDDCVVTALQETGQSQPEIGDDERRALRVLADARLVAPLRLDPPVARAS
jgi:hypothetical protein